MESLVVWFVENPGQYISKEAVIFIISMIPILELRGGLLAASLLEVPITTAIPLCIVGNIIPVPIILLFVKKIFSFMKRYRGLRGIAEFFEKRGQKKTSAVANTEFLGILLFVGIPLPMTGAWTGSLVAALLDMNFKKALAAIFLGIIMATIIMSILAYGLLGLIIQ